MIKCEINDVLDKKKTVLETVNINLGGKSRYPDIISGLKFYDKNGVVKIDASKLPYAPSIAGWTRYIYKK